MPAAGTRRSVVLMSGNGTIRIGRLAGIPIGVHPLWVAIVALITVALGSSYYPDRAPGLGEAEAYLLGLASALALFAGIVLHELGHAVVARRRGMEVEEIDLWLLGGVARITGQPKAPGDELRFASAGPAVTAAIVAVTGAVRLVLGGHGSPALRAFVDYQLLVNAAILGFNLLPAFPLDGGRLARALLWKQMGDIGRATETAARIGQAFGTGLMVLGVLAVLGGAAGGLWIALLGGFILVAAGAEAQRQRTGQLFGDLRIGDVMVPAPVSVPAWATLEHVVARWFVPYLYSAFPVTDGDGRVVGVLTIDDVRAVPAAERALRRAGEAAERDPSLLVTADTPVQDVLLSPVFQRVGRVAVVDGEGRMIGLVSITDLQRRVRAQDLLPRAREVVADDGRGGPAAARR
jgi:Zn-dependent protease/CBS domain-containing protein